MPIQIHKDDCIGYTWLAFIFDEFDDWSNLKEAYAIIDVGLCGSVAQCSVIVTADING